MWPFWVLRTARLLPALMVLLARDCAQVWLVLFVLCAFIVPVLIDLCALPTFDLTPILANCDASELLPNAETVGDCSAALPSGSSCTNTAASGFTCVSSTSCLDGILTPGLCAIPGAVIDLALVTSPYSGSTTGNSNDVAVCGSHSGAEQGFAGVLEPGSTITIGQTSNTFDSKHTLRYGGVYPGDNVVGCVDNPDEAELSFTNAGNANVPVYFIVDSYSTTWASTSGGGDFVVAWSGDFVAGGELLMEYFLLNYM
jgi:hypothetical protein